MTRPTDTSMIPQYCTCVDVAVLSDGRFIMFLSYREDGFGPVPIAKVMITKAHAESIRDILTKALNGEPV